MIYDAHGHKIPPPPGATPGVQAAYLGHSVLPVSPRPRRSNLTGPLVAVGVALLLVLTGMRLAPSSHTTAAAAAAPTTAPTVPAPTVVASTPVESAPAPEPSASATVPSDDTIVQGIGSLVNGAVAPSAPEPKVVPKPKVVPRPVPAAPAQNVVRYPKWYLIGYEASEGIDWTIPSSEVAQVCYASATNRDNPNTYAWDYNAEDETSGCIDGYHDQQRGVDKLTPEEKAVAGAS